LGIRRKYGVRTFGRKSARKWKANDLNTAGISQGNGVYVNWGQDRKKKKKPYGGETRRRVYNLTGGRKKKKLNDKAG